jgi:hypothetical protein
MAALKIKVKVTEVSETEIVGGKYPKKAFLGETEESDPKYVKTINFILLGEKAVDKAPKVGEIVNVSFDIQSHQYNGKWYTDIRAFDVEVVQGVVMAPDSGSVSQSAPTQKPAPKQNYTEQVKNTDEETIEHGSDADNLPF